MLEIRPSCENCSKDLAYDSIEAMICSFECTFCETCVNTVLKNVCPNCGGGFEKRPVRPSGKLKKYPALNEKVVKPVQMENFEAYRNERVNILPQNR